MKSTINWLSNHNPLQPHAASNVLKHLGQSVQALCQTLLNSLASSREPNIWQTPSATGQQCWNAADPITGLFVQGISAAELRVWLEERHK